MDDFSAGTPQHAAGFGVPAAAVRRARNAAADAGPGRGTGFLFLLATLASMAALAGTYYFFVRTTTGQFIDESALVEAVEIHGTAGKAANKLLDWLPALSLLISAVVVLIVTVVKRRWTAAGIAVAACVGANVATQILKDIVPDRPYRGIETLELNSLPSGHTTLAASAAAAVFLMVSPRWRPLAGFLGGSFAVATGVSTLINQWHRPADVVAAFLVVAVFYAPGGLADHPQGPALERLGRLRPALGLLPAVAGAVPAGGARRGRRRGVFAAERRRRHGPGGQHHALFLGRAPR